jgi:hypothetical protein
MASGAFTAGSFALPTQQSNTLMAQQPGFGSAPGYNTNQNQWGSFGTASPSTPMPGMNSPYGGYSTETGYSTPGAVPIPGSPNPTNSGPVVNQTSGSPQYAGNPVENAHGLGHGQYAVPPQDQGLQNTVFNYLQGQTGQGITPYSLSAALPSGGTSGPGQVASPLDPVSQQLEQLYSSGTSSNPALQALSQMATTGDPVNATPEWQAMLAALQQQQQIGAANVSESEAFTGNLPGSAGALAESQYQNQATLNNQSLIAQLTDQSLENAATRQQTAQNTVAAGAASTGQNLYSYDQNAIQQLMNEYFQTTPQENPLNQEEFSGATTYPPTFGGQSSAGLIGAIGGAAGSILGGAGSLAAGIGSASSASSMADLLPLLIAA